MIRILVKSKILFSLTFLVLLTLGTTAFAQTQEKTGKTVLETISGDKKTCKYVEKGLYKPFSNISTDFVLFKDILNLEKVEGGECLKVAGSTDKFVFMLFRIFIGVSAVLAVIYISVAGIGLILQEADPKKRIKSKQMLVHALVGLLLSVGAWVLLYTVNNKLVNFNFFTSAIDNTGFGGVIGQGIKDARAGIEVVDKNKSIIAGQQTGGVPNGVQTISVPPGSIDPRTGSISFAQQGRLTKVADIPEYVERGYQPTTVDGKTFYLGKTTTFGGTGDRNSNSEKKLAIDDSLREIDLDQDNDEYIAARWVYSLVGKQDLKDYDVEVLNPTTGKSIILQPQNGIAVKDWGPNPVANSNADYDTSRKVLQRIGVPDGGQIGVRLIPKQ